MLLERGVARLPPAPRARRQTRQRILDAARALFVDRGHAGLTMQAIAKRAGVALDTVYATTGRKPQLVRLLVETAISDTDQAVPAEQRDYDADPRGALGAREAGALRGLGRRHPGSARARGPRRTRARRDLAGDQERRARNMKLSAADLIATGEIRADLDAEIADVLWATNGAELYTQLVVQRSRRAGCSPGSSTPGCGGFTEPR